MSRSLFDMKKFSYKNLLKFLRHKSNFAMIIAAIVFVIIFFVFYPPIYSSMDENEYLSTALLIKSGTIYYDALNISQPPLTIKVDDHIVSIHPPGTALLITPFLYLSNQAVYLRSLFLHLIGFLFIYLIFRHVGANHAVFFSLLYLFYPALVIQSRMLMSDLPSAVFVLGGLYFYLSSRRAISGLFWGVAFIIRYTNVLIFFPFLGATVWRCINKQLSWKEAIYLILGFVPFVLIGCIYNSLAYGHWAHLPLLDAGFELKFLPNNLGFYLKSLFLIYPFMLIAPLFYRGQAKWEIRISVLIFLLFHSTYYYIQHWDNSLERIVLGVRLLLPIIPFMLVCYPFMVNKIIGYLKLRKNDLSLFFMGCISILLFIGSLSINYRHQEYLVGLAHYRDVLNNYIPKNAFLVTDYEIPKLLNPIWGKRYYSILSSDDKKNEKMIEKALSNGERVFFAFWWRTFKPGMDRLVESHKYILGLYTSDKIYTQDNPYAFNIYELKN